MREVKILQDKNEHLPEGLDSLPIRPLTILSENPLEQIWVQLSVWESTNLARKLVSERAQRVNLQIGSEKLERKAQALSYCIRTARENIRIPAAGLTVGSVGNYYGCMWLAAAMLSADPANDIDLVKLEQFTKRGHGLGNLAGETGTFPENEFLYVRESGFFREFLKARGISKDVLSEITIRERVSAADIAGEHAGRFLSLGSLFARVPELSGIYEYVTGSMSLIFGLSHWSRNTDEDIKDAIAEDRYNSPSPKRSRDYSWLAIGGGERLTIDHLRRNGPPLTDFRIDTFAGQKTWVGKLLHPAGTYWHQSIPLHRSAMSGTSWIKPLFNSVEDVFVVHLILLYALSILARYRPAVWREVIEGSLDQYRTLITGYHDIFQRVVPELALRAIYDQPIHVTQPGSFSAPL